MKRVEVIDARIMTLNRCFPDYPLLFMLLSENVISCLSTGSAVCKVDVTVTPQRVSCVVEQRDIPLSETISRVVQVDLERGTTYLLTGFIKIKLSNDLSVNIGIW